MKTRFFSLLLIPVCIFVYNCDNSKNNSVKGEISSCGGFQKQENTLGKFLQNFDSVSYCSAERVIWEYDETDSCLTLLHTRQTLNCAAELKVEALVDQNNITVIETDMRDPNIGTGCDCPFDTYLKIPDITTELITVNYSKKAFTLNLSEKKGTCVLDPSLAESCM